MMKYICFLLFLFISAGAYTQGILEVKNPQLTVKNLMADNQYTAVTYMLKNTGNQPILISKITPMTSLLKVEWDKSPLLPGKTKEIKISFIPASMSEKFNYRILIYSNSRSNNRLQLELSGNIVDNPQKPELLYKYDMDGVKFKTNSLNFNTVYTWQVVSDTLPFINTLKEPVTIGVQNQQAHIRTVAVPAKVNPGEKGLLIVTYDAPKKNDYGYSYETIILSFNHERNFSHRLLVSANLVEDFSKLSKQDRQNAPLAHFDKKEVSFGELKQGERANCDFTLTNKGKSNLYVRKTRASCGCTAVTLGENTIAPGKSTVIRVTFNSTGKSGRQYKSITVITNYPENPEMILNVNGNIKVK